MIRICIRLILLKHSDMNASTKLAAINKFRGNSNNLIRQPTTKVLLVYDVVVKVPEIQQVPLVINYGTHAAYTPALARAYTNIAIIRLAESRRRVCSSVCNTRVISDDGRLCSNSTASHPPWLPTTPAQESSSTL